jgi:hypothetical protein
VLILRLKQCEVCLGDGRLDEAFEIARQPDVRSHRRGQDLLNRLTKALVARGGKHLAADQIQQAKADCDKAALLGGNLPDISRLQSDIGQAMLVREEANRKVAQALATAKHHAMQGQLTVGQHILAGVSAADARIDGLKADLVGRRTALDSCIAKATQALKSGDWEAAIDHLSPVSRGNVQDAELRELCGKISNQLIDQATEVIESGRLDQSGALLRGLDRLPIQNARAEIHRTTIEQCRVAYKAIEEARPQDAEEILRRLAVLWPKAKWLSAAAEQARELGDMFATLHGSPLSLVAFSTQNNAVSPARGPMQLPFPNANPRPAAPRPVNGINQSFCLHVDGIGSFQIFTGSAITLGPISGSRSVDLPLMVDASAPTVTISRSDEDYFLKSSRPVQVNESPMVSKLLGNGDRIGLGTRCRITFRRPSAASSSAVLDFSGTRLSDSSIRQVVLLDRELIMGPGPAAHIRADELTAPVVIQRRGETITCRCAAEISIDGKPAGRNADIQPGANVAIGPVRFVIAREEVA